MLGIATRWSLKAILAENDAGPLGTTTLTVAISLHKGQNLRSLNTRSLFMYWHRSVAGVEVAIPRLAAKPLVVKHNVDCIAIFFSETRRIRIIDEEDSSGFTEATKIDHEKLKLKEKIEKLEKLVNGKSVEVLPEECQNNNKTPVKSGTKDPSAPAVVEGAPQRGFFSPCYMTLNGDKSYQYQVIFCQKIALSQIFWANGPSNITLHNKYSLVCYFGSKYLSLGPSYGHTNGCIKNFH